jgi:dihydrofolate reductase
MAKIVISTNVSLDGVVEDPDGGEGFARGNWFPEPGSADRTQWARIEAAEAMNMDALLLGRKSYKWFAQRWASRSDEWAERMNTLTKFVASTSLDDDDATWGPTTIIRNDVAKEVAALKGQFDGEIVVYGSYELGRTLLEHDLVDELRLFVFPVVLGAGRRLFGATTAKKPLQLVDSVRVGESLTFSTYRVLSKT